MLQEQPFLVDDSQFLDYVQCIRQFWGKLKQSKPKTELFLHSLVAFCHYLICAVCKFSVVSGVQISRGTVSLSPQLPSGHLIRGFISLLNPHHNPPWPHLWLKRVFPHSRELRPLRNTMSQERLNALAMVSMENRLIWNGICDFNHEVAERFVSLKETWAALQCISWAPFEAFLLIEPPLWLI